MADTGPPLRTRGTWRNPAVAGGLAVVAVLLFCWPFVRAPRLDLRETFLHLFAAWGVVILLLWRTSRRLGSGLEPGGPADD